MKIQKRIFSLLLCMFLLIGFLPTPPFASKIISGSSNDLDWALNPDGLLTICGERDMDVFAGRSATLNLDGRTEINFYFAIPEAVKANAVSSGTMFWTDAAYESATALNPDTAEYVVDLEFNEGVGRWQATYPVGFNSKQYETTVYACAYITDADGNTYYSGLVSYSVEQYCANQIKNAKEEAELCKYIVNYGDKAMSYFASRN